MSGFVLERSHSVSVSELLPYSYNTIIQKKGLTYSGHIIGSAWILRLFSNQSHNPYTAIARGPDRSFCTYVGTLMFRGRTGLCACELILPILVDNPTSAFEQAFGNFILIWQVGECLFIRSDLAGLNHFYATDDGCSITNFFLVSVALDGKRKLSQRGVEQYIYLGATYGSLTPFESIRRIKPDEQVEVSGLQFAVRDMQSPWRDPHSADLSIDERLTKTRDSLRKYFETIRDCYGDNVRASLTGGFDSRLLLALVLESGIRPSLFVYGGKTSPDVNIAKKLARAVGLDIDAVDRHGSFDQMPAEEYWECMEQQHVGLDGISQYGSAWFPDEFTHRFTRNGRNTLHLNGGGGEIWRFFWRPYVNGMTAFRFAQDNYQGRFKYLGRGIANESRLLSSVCESLADVLGIRSDQSIDHHTFNTIYARLRLTYWQGANNTVDNHIGISLTPFSECRFSVPAADLLDKHRFCGTFEARLIADINPVLASIDSSYGYRFDQPPPRFRRLVDRITRVHALTPPIASLYRQLKPREAQPYFLTASYLKVGFPGRLLTRNFVDIENLKSSMAISRLFTIERLMRAC